MKAKLHNQQVQVIILQVIILMQKYPTEDTQAGYGKMPEYLKDYLKNQNSKFDYKLLLFGKIYIHTN